MDKTTWTDDRPLDEIPFHDLGQDMLPPEEVREFLRSCGALTAQQVAELGCTGTYALSTLTVDERIRFSQKVRQSLAGVGIIMTCYVPDSLYCLIHGCVGGLQPQQKQQFAEALPSMTRELHPNEIVGNRMVKHAISRYRGETGAHEILSGAGDADDLARAIGDRPGATDGPAEPPAVGRLGGTWTRATDRQTTETVWKCPEHSTLTWSCRYCVAAEIVAHGSLVPDYQIIGTTNACVDGKTLCPGGEVDRVLVEQVRLRAEKTEIWVRLGAWSLGLVRSD